MTSHAKTLTPSPIRAASPRPDFNAVRDGMTAKPQGRPSTMVAYDRPAPVPHPTPDIAGAADRAAFNAKWNKEEREACEAREARRASFKEKRMAGQSATRSKNITRKLNR